MSYLPHVIVIVVIFSVLGTVVYYNSGDVNQTIQDAEDIALQKLASLTEVNDVGDVVQIFKGKPTLVQETTFVNEATGQKLTEEEFINYQESQGVTITEEDIILMKIEGGESFGYTVEYELKELPEHHYQIGNPVLFSGVLQKVIEGSCGLNQETGLAECDYIEPATFTYSFFVECDFRDFCNLNTITRTGEKTLNDGSWSQKVQTNPTDFPPGDYQIRIEANSEVINPDTSRPYLIKAVQQFTMVK